MTPSPPALAPPERLNFAAHLFDLNRQHPDRIAYVDDAGTLSYGQLQTRARQLAAALLALGVRREERVLLLMQDTRDWPVSFLGALYAGIVPVAVNTLLTANDYAHMLAHSRAQAAMVSGALLPVLQQAMTQNRHELRAVLVSRPEPEQVDPEREPTIPTVAFDQTLAAVQPLAAPADTGPDDLGFWLYSSGSTGAPKGVVHTHGNLWWTVELYGKAVLGISARDVCFSAAKLFFAYGLGNGLSFPLSAGATVVLWPGRPTPEACFARWLDPRFPPTIFFGAPTGFAGMLAAPDLPARDAVRLRMCSSAGEALPADIGQRFKAHFGVDIIDGIGSTEMLHVFLSARPGQVRYGATGKPVAGYEVELRDETGSPVPDGVVGDLYVSGPSSALLYWANREKSRDTFRGAWTKSGDKYVRDAQGYYIYAGRSDDMLKVSGQYVSPFEVEATLMQHPAVLEAAVIGVEDGQGLTKTKAFVVLKPGHPAGDDLMAELQAFVKARLAPHKYPRQIAFVDDLPKTATGKIQRFRLRESQQDEG